jgi:hypothetical protein
VANTHPYKSQMSTHRPLELLHMDLFGPTSFMSIGGNSYCLIIVDDYSRFTWVYFLQDKSNVFETFNHLLYWPKINLILTSRKLEVIMGRNSKMLELMNIMMTRALNMNYLPNTHRNKMELLRGKIGLLLICLGLC